MSQKINVHDDFLLLEKFVDAKGLATAIPTCNWRISYHTTPFLKYVASYIDGEYRNCKKAGECQIVVSFDNHKLGVGKLFHTLELDLGNTLFADGQQNIFLSDQTEYELIFGDTTAIGVHLEDLDIDAFSAEFIAAYVKGTDGITPHIGDNGNWWSGQFDTGIYAKGIRFKEFSSYLKFPLLGKNDILYIDTTANKMYRWDSLNLKYCVIGSNYNDIKIINGGNA